MTIDGKPYTADSASRYVVRSQTLTPGGPTITVNNVPYALPPSVTAIISNGRTIALDAVQTTQASLISLLSAAGFGTNNPPQTYTMDGLQLTGGPSVLAMGSTTLAPGSPPLVTSGHTLSLAAGGALIVDGRTSLLSATSLGSNYQHQTYTIDGIQLTGDPDTLTADGRTSAPGSPALVISGYTFSLATGGALVIDGHISTLSATGLGSDNPAQTYNIDGIHLTGNSNALAVGSTTLAPGSQPLTLSGHTLSLASGGALIVDGSTSVLISEMSLSSPSKGAIAAATTEGSISGNISNLAAFTGNANSVLQAKSVLRLLVLVTLCVALSSR